MIKIDFSKRFLNRFFFSFTVILIVFTVLVVSRGMSRGVPLECEKIEIKGSLSYDDGHTYHTLDSRIGQLPTKYDNVIILGHLDHDLVYGRPVYLFVQGLKVKIYVNGKVVFDHTDFSEDTWDYFVPGAIKTTDDIKIELSTDKSYIYNVHFRQFLKRMYQAERYDLIRVLLSHYMPHLLVCLAITIMGISILIYWACFRGVRDYNAEGLRSCGILMIMGGITCYLDYNYVTLLSRNLYFLSFLNFVTQAMLVIFMTSYMRRYVAIEESRRRANTIIVTMVVFMAIYMLHYILKETTTNFDWLFMAFVLAVMVMLFIGLRDVYKEGMVIPVHNRMAFDTLLLLVSGFIIEIIYYVLTGTYIVRVIEVCLLVFSVAQYYLLVSTNVDNYLKAKRARELESELVQNKIKLMLGQIQPHFLYNAIGTIRALCIKNPKEARNALDYFAKFLRANMDSLTEEGCIPFEKELDHVKSYLYIEKLRFGELLDVEFDIKATDFECPPLMLQTMVENAVKHGLMPKKDGGKIKISTSETKNCYEIKVADDGVGYDTDKPLEDGRSHIGVDNTRQRIVALCNGTMNIGSRMGSGTTITIIIPKATMPGGGYESNIG